MVGTERCGEMESADGRRNFQVGQVYRRGWTGMADSRSWTGVEMARAAGVVDYRWQVVGQRCGEVGLCRLNEVFQVMGWQVAGREAGPQTAGWLAGGRSLISWLDRD